MTAERAEASVAKVLSDTGERPWRSSDLHGGDEYSATYEDLTHALGDFLDRLAEARPDTELIESMTESLAGWARELGPLAVRERDRVFGRRTDLASRGQTMSPTIELAEISDDSASGTVYFGSYFLGGNGAVHGGAIPLMFDEILGRLANASGRPPQRTAYLHTDYRSITPVGRTLGVRAWLCSEDGRKRILRATIHDGETLCAEAEGLFVALKPGQP
ncbi:PaaI family thioesterase [Gordonia liuliyuniae]|uniref:Acyl-coenzyme A thioesterase THEM4 n=1 Tax=Gordonia liuliyuniae TaxID=2911517 RepID=A0ABS9IP02_9ACTN|nr:PaaI family thioesterase [Gordonia liuliyuniae]MCF8587296.1 PaaI family thioesterase [Gordonia liuliyuniae]